MGYTTKVVEVGSDAEAFLAEQTAITFAGDAPEALRPYCFIIEKADLVGDLRESIDKAIELGTGLEEFRRDFSKIVQKHGWTGWTGEGSAAGEAWRTRVIYQTNMATSYAADRYRQLTDPDFIALFPFWRYVHNDGVMHPRPLHVSWDGLILRAENPWWRTHYPPNGWGCQCKVIGLWPRDLARLGKSQPDQAPEVVWTDRLIGQNSPGGPREVTVPEGIDPGFEYAPGRDRWRSYRSKE